MNKLLIGTAAAALFTVPAVAGPMAVTVGGYYNAVVYSQDVDNTDTRDVGVVISVSKVPILRSPAILRIVKRGTTKKTGIQRTLKN